MTINIVALARAIAKTGLPVFPTRNKKPALSNQDLTQILGRTVARGEGGFHMATTDSRLIKKLFGAANTEEIAVPHGPQSRGGSGYLIVDVDLYKDTGVERWHEAHLGLLTGTMCIASRSGGLHYVFLFPEGLKHPATIHPGVDLKGHGGYTCWVGTPGYTLEHDNPIQAFPLELLSGTLNDKSGQSTASFNGAWTEATDDELVASIKTAEELYPALRTLSWRLAGTPGVNEDQACEILSNIMQSSDAAATGHVRHEDWAERYEKVSELVSSAFEKKKHPLGQKSDMMLEALSTEESLIPTFLAPREEVRQPREIPALAPFEPTQVSKLPPREWLYGQHMIRGFLTATVAPGGLGKSSLVIAETICMCTGRELLGVTVYQPIKVLYWCGEDPQDELEKRFSATMQHYDVTKEDLAGRLWVVSGRELGFNFAYQDHQDAKLNDEDIKAIREMIRELDIDLLILDPMASIHSISENSNNEMTMLLDALRDIADKEKCGIEIVHHSTKQARQQGGVMGAEQARGASAITDAARSVRALSALSKTDREEAGMTVEEAAGISMVRSVKGNMSPGGRSSSIRLVSVDLHNRTSIYPQGDSVGVATPTVVDRTAMTDWLDSTINWLTACDCMSSEPTVLRKDIRSKEWAGLCLTRMTGQSDPETAKRFAKGMLDRLSEENLITEGTTKTPGGRQVATYLVDEKRVAEICQILDPQ
jgi:RecA-family ATPase